MNRSTQDRIIRHASCPIRESVSLADYTSFHIGGPACLLAEPRSTHELVSLCKLLRSEDVPTFYLGHGSNILVSDDGFDGVVVRATGQLCEIHFADGVVSAGPGARLLELTTLAAYHELSGMEPLSGIPGSVGGALYMNAGAYGGEICNTLADVDVLNGTGSVRTLKNQEIGFGYRTAPALQETIILESRYRLASGDKHAVTREMRRVWKLRRAKQPLEYPSAGSIFKRPPGDFAGRLIEAVGAKGMRVGDAMVSEKHAGIFVNVGAATASDVAELIRRVRSMVVSQFGILLENEVKPVGFAKDPFAVAS